MKPLVSVIVPVYNVQSYMQEALDSVINQTYENLEILIVDDGSTDASGNICDKYLSDPRVKVIHQKNKGLGGARNTALDQMSGEYVAFLDSDDAFMPEMIEHMMEALLRKGTNIVMCSYESCWTEGSMNATDFKKTSTVFFDDETLVPSSKALNMLVTGKISWNVWNKIYRSSLWKNIRFPEKTLFEDVHVMHRIFEQCDYILYIPEPLVQYRRRESSITRTTSLKHLQDGMLCSNLIENYILQHTPSIFSPESARQCFETNAISLSKHYANLPTKDVPQDVLEHIRKEVVLKWKRLEGEHIGFEAKAIRFLILHSPRFLPHAQSLWQIGKRLFRKG